MSYMWYATRATGEVALLFLTIVLALGVMSAIRFGGRKIPRFVIAGIHRNLTLAGLGFLVVHITTTIIDSYAPISLLDAFVPFASAYRPIWLGLGTLAFDLLVALTVTSLLRTRIGLRWWKLLHWTAYACWMAALVHALGTGSDVRTSTFLFVAGICCAVALAAVGWRIAESGPGREVLRVGTAVFAVAAVAAIAVFTAWGPLEPGWAKRSGTPANLLPKPPAVTTTGGGG